MLLHASAVGFATIGGIFVGDDEDKDAIYASNGNATRSSSANEFIDSVDVVIDG